MYKEELVLAAIVLILIAMLASTIILRTSAMHQETMKLLETDYGKCLHLCNLQSENFDTKGCITDCEKVR